MSNFELTIHCDGEEIRIFLQPGFFDSASMTTTLHKHRYTEIHLVEGGNTDYLVGDRHYLLEAGQLIVIPPDTFHMTALSDINTKRIAFQLSKNFDTVGIYNSTPGIYKELLSEIKYAKQTRTCGMLNAYLTQICAVPLCKHREKLLPLQDRGFIIHEFLHNNYASEITLADLADELKLSPKQTERLVMEYTGNSFRKELSKRRIEAAKHLLATENIMLAEVAERVGYHSYSGFWKAFHDQ